jgi:hypothetical protein
LLPSQSTVSSFLVKEHSYSSGLCKLTMHLGGINHVRSPELPREAISPTQTRRELHGRCVTSTDAALGRPCSPAGRETLHAVSSVAKGHGGTAALGLGGPRALPAPPGSDGHFCSTAPAPPRHPRASPAPAVALGCMGLRLCKARAIWGSLRVLELAVVPFTRWSLLPGPASKQMRDTGLVGPTSGAGRQSPSPTGPRFSIGGESPCRRPLTSELSLHDHDLGMPSIDEEVS